jgi:hypothetical protein
MIAISIVPIERLELTFTPQPWPFSEQRRQEIDVFSDRLRTSKLALWNGRVLISALTESTSADSAARSSETDYASMLAWKNWGSRRRRNELRFAQGAVRSADERSLLGVMAPHTANSGQIYFVGRPTWTTWWQAWSISRAASGGNLRRRPDWLRPNWLPI